MEQGIPIVLFDRVTDEIQCDKVVLNDKEIAYKAVTKLLKNGRKRIALVTTESYFNVSSKRTEGYRNALEDHNIIYDTDLVLRLPYSGTYEQQIEYFVDTKKIDAALCVNELFAIQCMGAVKKKGRQIPEDISFIGFTDGLLSRYASPTLTTVAQHGERMGEAAARLLIEKVENADEALEEHFRTEIIEATLIERESTVNLKP